MLKKLTLLIAIILFLTGTSIARAKLQGIAGKGGKTVKTSTSVSYELLETYPNCTIDVYLTGTTTHATIYSDNSGTVKANSFFSNSTDASWSFYVDNGRYDIKFSGTGIVTPYTLSDYIFLDDVVIGPASSTDNCVARFDGTSGKLIQNSVLCISDTGDVTTTGKVFTLGNISDQDSSRIVFRTQGSDIFAIGNLTFNFTNGPVGEVNYKDETFQFSYNSNANGTKIQTGKINYGFVTESKFVSGSGFQNENYFSVTDPTNTLSNRPFGWDVQHSTLNTGFVIKGDINLFRHLSTGGAQTALLHENGFWDLSFLTSGFIKVANNTGGYCWANVANNNTICPLTINTSDETNINSSTNTIRSTSRFIIPSMDIGEVRSNVETDSYLEFPGSNIFRLTTGGVIKLSADASTLIANTTFICVTDGGCDLGKTSGVNFRFNNSYVKLISESGTFKSTVSTGTAPLDITSTTPVANLTLTSHPQVLNTSGALQISNKIVTGIATLSGGTLVVTFTSSAVFANTSYVCSGANQTNANAFKIVNTSASSITITGTGTDVIGFQCIGS